MKYDVFISYSRKDYVDELELVKKDSPVKAILEFLEAHNIIYWFDKNGLYSGSEFLEMIANAIADSKMMLFVSSSHSNESIYTAGEIFEAIENKKLIIPVRIDDSMYNKKYKLLLNPLDYIDFTKSDAFSNLLQTIEIEKSRIAKIEQDELLCREEQKKCERRKSIKDEIFEQVNELNKLKEISKALHESIYRKLRSIDVAQKQCPVCNANTEIDTEYCQTCGWYFYPLSNIEDIDVPIDKSALIMARTRLEKIICSSQEHASIDVFKRENKELKKTNDELKIKVEELNRQITSNKQSLPEIKSFNSFKSCFVKHNIVTAIMLCLTICGLALLGIVFYCISLNRRMYIASTVFLFFMSYSNYQLFRFKKWVWLVAPFASFFIGCLGTNVKSLFLFLCMTNLIFFALLFLLKKNGKNSYHYMKSVQHHE